jgi:hypothetical protein
MEQNNQQQLQEQAFPAGKQELIFAASTAAFSLLLCNSIYAGGYNLGFALYAIGLILCSVGYFWSLGRRPDGYSGALLGCSLLLAASFGWSCDGFVKFFMFGFLLLSFGLGLCLMAGQNRRDPARAGSFWDGANMLFRLGFGKLPESCRGLVSVTRSGSAAKKTGAVLLGLCFAIPVLGIVLPLLTGADAAFEGLMDLLPELEIEELVFTVIFGMGLALVTYSQGVAGKYVPQPAPAVKKKTGLSPLTVNTVLGCLCFVYLVYLFSQLAYFVGGFAGLLPEKYSLSAYARRGFFEMATLCGVNLAVILGSLGLVKRDGRAALSTRILCLLIGVMSLFFVCAASAKMFMYIGSYGLTRLRLLTQIIMLFFAFTTIVVAVWLFVPKLPYMKVVILGAMVIGLATVWLDVDSMVARYNVDAYLSGRMEQVDVDYLRTLSDGAQLQLERLAEQAPDRSVALQAEKALHYKRGVMDLREWNYFNAVAGKDR